MLYPEMRKGVIYMRQLKWEHQKSTVKEILEEAWREVSDLSEFLRDCQSKLEGTNFVNTPKYDEMRQAADDLGAISNPLEDLVAPDGYRSMEVSYTWAQPYGLVGPARRLSRVVAALNGAVEAITDEIESGRDFIRKLECLIADLEAVEFPGERG